MKFAVGLLMGMAAGLLTAWRVHAHPKHVDLLYLLLKVVAGAAGLFLMSLLLPDDLASLAADFLAWCLAGAVAALAVLAGVKGLEGLLDS